MGSLPTNPLIRSVAVDPLTPTRVYAAGPAGLFKSDDGGLHWTAMAKEIVGEPLAVTLNPAAPGTVVVVLVDGTVWQSADGGLTWRAAEGQ
jgi:photosystem II stability/assembly factor-like uncharacterized protein